GTKDTTKGKADGIKLHSPPPWPRIARKHGRVLHLSPGSLGLAPRRLPSMPLIPSFEKLNSRCPVLCPVRSAALVRCRHGTAKGFGSSNAGSELWAVPDQRCTTERETLQPNRSVLRALRAAPHPGHIRTARDRCYECRSFRWLVYPLQHNQRRRWISLLQLLQLLTSATGRCLSPASKARPRRSSASGTKRSIAAAVTAWRN